MRAGACRFCGAVLPHQARAAAQVAQIHAAMADRNGNGVPDILESMMGAPPPGAGLAPPLTGHPMPAPVPPPGYAVAARQRSGLGCAVGALAGVVVGLVVLGGVVAALLLLRG
jgi:hypothetical protein